MRRFRSHWLAVFAGATLIALSVSTAFGAKPETNTGQQVSAYVHSLVGDVEEPTDEQVDDPADTETDTQDATDTEVVGSQPSDHGKCVSEVAKGDTFGGDNVNHGGAVSEAARVTCWLDASTVEPTTEQPTDNQADSEVEADASTETEADAPDKSDSGHEHGGDHANKGDKGDKGDSSED